MVAGFRKISIKATLINRVEEQVKTGQQYRSISEFISEATRLRLEQLEKRKKKEA